MQGFPETHGSRTQVARLRCFRQCSLPLGSFTSGRCVGFRNTINFTRRPSTRHMARALGAGVLKTTGTRRLMGILKLYLSDAWWGALRG